MTNRMQNELRDQTHQHSVTEEQSEIISELQREVKEQATTIKQQAVVMEELQAAMMKQTEMFSEQQQLMRETWWEKESGKGKINNFFYYRSSVVEMKQTLQTSVFQS